MNFISSLQFMRRSSDVGEETLEEQGSTIMASLRRCLQVHQKLIYCLWQLYYNKMTQMDSMIRI